MSEEQLEIPQISAERFQEIMGDKVEQGKPGILSGDEHFSKAYAEANTDVRNLYNYVSSYMPDISYGLELRDDGLRLLDSEEMYGKDFANPLVSPQVRRDAIRARKDAQILRDYWSTPDEGGGVAAMLGSLAGYASTPTSLIPLGRGLAMGAASGAALGGGTMALEGLAEKGEIDPVETGMGIAFGGLLGGGFGAFTTKPLSKPAAKASVKASLLNNLDDEQLLTGGIIDLVSKTEGYATKPTLGKPLTHNKGKARRMEKDLNKLRAKLTRSARKESNAGGESYLDGPSKRITEELSHQKVVATNIVTRALDDPQMSRQINMDGSGKPPHSVAAEQANEGGQQTGRQYIEDGDFLWDSVTGEKIAPNLTKIADMEVSDTSKWYEALIHTRANGHFMTRPSRVLENFGPMGKWAAEQLRKAEESSMLRTAQGMNDFGTTLVKHGIEDIEGANLVTDILRKSVDPKTVPAHYNRAAKEVASQFEGILGEAHRVGILSSDEYTKLLARGREKGYWPRVYDHGFLDTVAGKAAWEEALTGVAFTSRESAEQAMMSITGATKPKDIQALLNKLEKLDDGKQFRMSKNLARELWKQRGRAVKDKRSSHLEYSRKIPAELEEALTPFLVRDPEAVVTQYMQDVFGRIEYARNFGANDKAAQLITEKLAHESPEVADMFNEVFLQSVRSTNSKNIQSFIDKPESLKRAVGSLKSLESLKLLFSPVVNAGQAIINGSAALQATTGVSPIQGYTNSLRAIAKGFQAVGGNQGLQREVARSGASLQTVVMANLGGMEAGYHTLFQKRFEGALSPLEFINNPATFLKGIGFFKVEEFNRSVGYFMGKAQAESLIENKLRLLKAGDRASPKKLAKVDRGLRELGLDPNIRWDLDNMRASYTTNDLNMAAQRFSNEVNFINTAITLPTSWNSFYGKLTRQFQSFSYHQGTFIRDKMLKPLREGNPLPLMTYLGVGTPIGMSLAEFKRFLVQDDKEYTGMEQYLSVMSHFGGAGITLDYLKQSYYSPLGLAGALVGPGLSDVSEIASAATKSIAGSIDAGEIDMSPLAKAGAKMMVYPGKKEFMKNFEEEKGILDSVLDSAFESPFEE